MKNLYKMMFMVLFGAHILYAEDGISQPRLINTIPTPDNANVPPNITLSFTFDSTIVEKSINSHTIILKQRESGKHKIQGNVSVTDENTLVFSPRQQLEKAIYDIKVKPLKLKNPETHEIHPKTNWQKFIAWLCGLVYDDIRNCPLCQYVCNIPNNITTKPIHFNFEVKDDAPKVISLESDTTLVELSEYNTTQLTITATYDNNSSEDVTQKATYTSDDSSVDVDNGTISTNQEGSATITVSYGGETTEVQVEVYEMIEGHLLPHEPDNPDDTLLGVDANKNGVRDEVERWIYKEMPTYHHPEIERVIAMQKAKAYQSVLVDPTNQNDSVVNATNRAIDCWYYYSILKDLPMDGAVQEFSSKLTDKSFNTKERLRTYLDYDHSLKGRAFTDSLESINDCDTNIDVMP